MLRSLVVVAAGLLLGSCTHSPNRVGYYGEDGRTGWSTQCNNADQSFLNCANSARIICGGEFEEIKRTEGTAIDRDFLQPSETYPVRRLDFICTNPAANPPDPKAG